MVPSSCLMSILRLKPVAQVTNAELTALNSAAAAVKAVGGAAVAAGVAAGDAAALTRQKEIKANRSKQCPKCHEWMHRSQTICLEVLPNGRSCAHRF